MVFARSGAAAAAAAAGGEGEAPSSSSSSPSASSTPFVVTVRKVYLREGQVGETSAMFDLRARYHAIDFGGLGDDGMIVNSGAEPTRLVAGHASDEFRRLWKSITGGEYANGGVPVSIVESELSRLPTIVFQLVPHNGGVGDEVRTDDPREVPGLAGNIDVSTPNDVMLAIPPGHYMRKSSESGGSDDGTYTPGIYLDADVSVGNVLGANAMAGHDFMFDAEHDRIGISESDCAYSRLVSYGQGGGGGGGFSSPSPSSSSGSSEQQPSISTEDVNIQICESRKCRTFFGLTMAAFVVALLLFARRYINRRDMVGSDIDGTIGVGRGGGNGGGGSASSEFEMKSPRTVPSHYSDGPENRDSGRTGNRRGDRGGGGGGGGGGRELARGDGRSGRSLGAHGAGESVGSSRGAARRTEGSVGSRDTRRTSQSHGSSHGRDRGASESSSSAGRRSHATNHRSSTASHRSGQSHRSTTAGGGSVRSSNSRENRVTSGSNRTSGGGVDEDRDRFSGDNFRSSGSRRNREGYDDDEIPMPPSIT